MSAKIRGLLEHDLLWGLRLGAAVVLCIQVLTWVGLGLTFWTWTLTYVLVVVFAVLGARSLRKRSAARPGVVRTVVLITLMILVSRVIYQTYMFVYLNFVDPTWVDTVAEVWSAQLRHAGAADEKIAMNIAEFRNQWETGYIFSIGIVRWGIPQFILGLVAAAVSAAWSWRRSSVPSVETAG